MYKKFLIIASKKDLAGLNIVNQLLQYKNPVLSLMEKPLDFDFYLEEEEIIFTENLDKSKIEKYDFIIFASKHSSSENKKTLSIHAPGNWSEAKFGGESKKLNKTSAVFAKQLFENLNNSKQEHLLQKYEVTMEATHHGPLIDKPCLFIEIGSTPMEWKDRRAGFVVAQAILNTIKTFSFNPYNEIAIAIGGPHYCPSFNKIQLNSNVAISHVIPKYVFPLTEEMVKEAISKTEEEIDFAIIDWKGMGTSEERTSALEVLNKLYLNYKKVSEFKK